MEWYLFDLDNTLIKGRIYADIYNYVIKEICEKYSTDLEGIDKKATELGLKRNQRDRWDTGTLAEKLNCPEIYYGQLNAHCNYTYLIPQTKAALDSLNKKNHNTGIVSNSMKRTIHTYMRNFNLDVDFVFSSEDAKAKKDTDYFWESLARLVDPANTLIIGDNLYEDIEMAQRHGFNTFHFKENKSKPKDILQYAK
ncbi:MAG: HAD family hydrolase [Nanobdellota archaeon]